jgi:hypothetical protein
VIAIVVAFTVSVKDACWAAAPSARPFQFWSPAFYFAPDLALIVYPVQSLIGAVGRKAARGKLVG